MVFCNKEELKQYLPYFILLVGRLPKEDTAQGEEEDLDSLADLLKQSCPCLPSPSLPTNVTWLNTTARKKPEEKQESKEDEEGAPEDDEGAPEDDKGDLLGEEGASDEEEDQLDDISSGEA